MAPSIYEWMGITLKLYSNDHEPVHVHAQYGEFESIYELILENGKIVEIRQREVEGSNPLPPQQHKLALRLVKKYKKEILSDWINFNILHKKIKFKRIRGKYL